MRVAVVLAVLSCAAAQEHGDADTDAVPCEPQLADNCWADVVGQVDCLLNPRSTRTHECRRLNHTELCKVFEDALRCSSDVADNGCVLRSGRESFDFWMRGLEAVNTKLCFEGLMENIVGHAACWDAMRFTRCVQHTVDRLHHVVDLADLLSPHQAEQAEPPQGQAEAFQPARVADSRQQCHLAMLRVSKCAAIAATLDPPPALEDPHASCLQAAPVDVINEMLAAYFSASECGGNPGHPAACPPPAPETAPTSPPPPQPAIVPAAPAPSDNGDPLLGRQGPLCASGGPAHVAHPMAVWAAASLFLLINVF